MIKYTKDHDWLDSGDNGVAVGLTDHATGELGDVVYVELPEVGAEVAKGEEIVVIESTKATSGIVAPFDGVITEVNQTVVDSPETVNEDPAGSWFFKIQPSDPSALDEYLSEDEYKALIG